DPAPPGGEVYVGGGELASGSTRLWQHSPLAALASGSTRLWQHSPLAALASGSTGAAQARDRDVVTAAWSQVRPPERAGAASLHRSKFSATQMRPLALFASGGALAIVFGFRAQRFM